MGTPYRWTSSAALIAVGLASMPLSSLAADVFYSGRATGIDAQTTILGTDQEVLIGDTGMSCVGLPHDEAVASFSSPSPLKVSAQSIKVHTLGKNGTAAADATMQNVALDVPGINITASSLGAHARATCDVATGNVTVSGHSDFGSVIVNGQAVDVKAKKQISIPNVGYVYFDQHKNYGDEMRVYAIHVRIDNPASPASGDVYIGKVRARTICNP